MANNDDENVIIVTWSNHLAANSDDGSAGKQAVSNTANHDAALCCSLSIAIYNIYNFIAQHSTASYFCIGKFDIALQILTMQ